MLFLAGLIAGSALFIWSYQGKKMSFTRLHSFIQVPHQAITKVKLDNGMQLLIFKNPAVPKVLLQIAYDVGSYVENSGERGLAHLLEHMIFKGTDTLSEVDIDGIGRKYGATLNAFTTADVTSYYFETNKNNWKPFVHILADCMQNARFEEQHLASEIKAVIQELKMGRDNYIRAIMYKALTTAFPAHHPYHNPTIGYKEDLLGISAAKLREFYRKYYRADRATLFVVGDVNPDEVIQEVRKEFGSIASEGSREQVIFPVVPLETQSTSVRMYEDINQEIICFYWLIPGLAHERSLQASALETIFGDGDGSRFHRLLVEEKKVATSVSVSARSFLQAGIFFILAEPLPGKGELCRSYIHKELTTAAAEGFSEQELDRMVKLEQSSFLHAMQSHASFVFQWIHSYFAVHNETDVFERMNRLNEITSAQLQSFIRDYLDPFVMNQIELLPLPETKKEIKHAAKKIADEFDRSIIENHQRTAPLEKPKALLKASSPEKLDFSFPKPDREFTLDNGLKVRIKKQGIWPLMSLHCQFKDAFYFTAAQQGILQELMMNMLIENSSGYSKHDHLKFFDARGCRFEAGKTGAHLSLLRADAQEVIERFLTILSQPTFPQDALERLRTITIQGFESCKDSPHEIATRLLKNSVYEKSDYAWTFDDAIEMIRQATTHDLLALHQRFVNPESMILSLVGDGDLDMMEKMIRTTFGSWKSSQGYLPLPVPAVERSTQKNIDYTMLRDQIVLLLGTSSPVTIYDEDCVPLRLLSSICFNSLGSRIFKLREQTGIFYTGFGIFAGHASKHHGFDFAGALLSKDKIDEGERMIKDMLTHVAKNGIEQEELDAARQLYLKDLIDSISTNGAVARMFCNLEALNLGYDYYDRVLQRVQTITVQELNAVAQKYIHPDTMTRIRVGTLS